MRIEFAPEARDDLRALFRHLYETHSTFGRSVREARDLARARARQVEANAQRLALAPGMGTRHDDLMQGLRHVTLDRAIYWFTVDEALQRVRVLAVWHGGQDHLARMMRRLTGAEGEAP